MFDESFRGYNEDRTRLILIDNQVLSPESDVPSRNG